MPPHLHRSVPLLLSLSLVIATAHATPRFHGSAHPLDASTRAAMTAASGSWHRGCPVSLADLWLIEVDHWGLDGAVHHGRLIAHRDHARALVGVFGELFALRFAIERIEPVDHYGSDDHRSMAANNTSAFNCREVNGRPGVWSQHAYGLALDLNPVQNPYVSGRWVSPPAGAPFVRRRPAPGLVTADGPVVRAFARIGWSWGGLWRGDRDYQHFSANGR